ncbi:hypothetical protein TL5118_01600 [Thalassovita autumnalis]|uniref:Lysozyme inhibitor LprI-like N-terminal domain-containing protein n=1 Tax=Thalassovita autumnalis TaxID=2072972 RepID=A0A0P1FDD3_9RHOB|nr:lysozyme inhibitor LprI family protein [Thalassovita autumnalis]CUH66086.1 hypothetical protein TL5118_01600 [Thalassovita autumnalis]CUH72479.1 hypothetical protein TL5120_02280 [Thalassovita autumnalis]
MFGKTSFLAVVMIAFGSLSPANAFDASRHLKLASCEFGDPTKFEDCAKLERERCQRVVDRLSLSTAGGLYACGDEYGQQADMLLNRHYKKAVAVAREADRQWNGHVEREQMLREAQRSWIVYRDKTCEINASWRRIMGGMDSVIADCVAELSIKQIQVLSSSVPFDEPW